MWAADYYEMLALQGNLDTDGSASIGNSLPFLAGRLSYVLHYGGPSVGLDTACSSSLTAMHIACTGKLNYNLHFSRVATLHYVLQVAAVEHLTVGDKDQHVSAFSRFWYRSFSGPKHEGAHLSA